MATLTDGTCMNSPARVTWFLERHGLRFLRYSGVAAFNVVLGQILLIAFYAGAGLSGAAANLSAASIGAVPAYLLNRYWVWEKRSPNLFWGEIVPFWAMILVGVALSTAAVAWADHQWDHVVAISAASLVAYGVVWVAKYAVLDSLLFRAETDSGVAV